MSEPIKVLIVDDSAVIRQVLSDILNEDPAIEVIGTAADPFIAADKMRQQVPDVITLDIEMPRMDGLTFLRKIMSQRPIPVIICSGLTQKGAEASLKAIQYGAVEIIGKPRLGARQFIEESKLQICDTVKAAAQAKVKIRQTGLEQIQYSPKHTADVVLAKPVAGKALTSTERVVAIGASTGGTEALRVFLQQLPPDAPAVVVVQHMPKAFTASFAQRLNELCKVSVREAEHGDAVLPGQVLIAPGDQHLLLKRKAGRYFVELKDGPLVRRHRPSVDVLFRSAATSAGSNAIGVIMTGMGDDGAQGLLELNQAGGVTMAQDEESCVVFGMPKEAIKLKAVEQILPLNHLAPAVLNICTDSRNQ
jgi:two-component system chemotaxis response regulator CheB